MDIYSLLSEQVVSVLKNTFQADVNPADISIEQTNEDFEGDFTIIVFSLSKQLRRSPVEIAQTLAAELPLNNTWIERAEVIKGFVNLSLHKDFWLNAFREEILINNFLQTDKKNEVVLVEFSSPNTNKPLHLGHIRNNLIGFSLSRILEFSGYTVVKNNLINDRGIHICKSMLAWMKYGNNETPETTGLKGDHLVGKYYVLYDQKLKEEIEYLKQSGMDAEQAGSNSSLAAETRELLLQWEQGNPAVLELWSKMNSWAYKGFDQTYKNLGVSFDKVYYESQTYLRGRDLISEGLQKGIFFKKDDGSVWIDLTQDGLDEKLLLRPDGTSVYITQDIGTAEIKFNDFKPDRSLYIVGDEQEYHFKVLKLILKKLEKPYADGIAHVSYGMVDLPEGRMKSREGTVVDADDLMEEMKESVKEYLRESGKWPEETGSDVEKISEVVGMGALKFYMLRTRSKNRMVFNPKESIDLHGFTGPFVLYTYARIRSVLRKGNIDDGFSETFSNSVIPGISELALINMLYHFPFALKKATDELEPSVIAMYVYRLAKTYNQFYHEYPILKELNPEVKNFRIRLSVRVGNILHNALNLLGIEVIDKM